MTKYDEGWNNVVQFCGSDIPFTFYAAVERIVLPNLPNVPYHIELVHLGRIEMFMIASVPSLATHLYFC